MTAQAARKVRRFAELCDAFHLPVISLVDEPGFMIGREAERAGTIRLGMEAMFAVLQTRVPWAAVLLRRSFGVAQGIHLGSDSMVAAWPSAESGALPIEGGVAVAFRREIAEADDPEAKRAELEERLSQGRTPFPRAESFGVHDLIDPRHTRPALCAWLEDERLALREHVARRGALEAEDGATIWVSTDGGEPDTELTGPLEIDGTTVVRAVAEDGLSAEEIIRRALQGAVKPT